MAQIVVSRLKIPSIILIQQPQLPLLCFQCKEPYKAKNSDPRTRYCSKRCKKRASKKRHYKKIIKKNIKRGRKKKLYNCWECGKLYPNNGQGSGCCQQCYSILSNEVNNIIIYGSLHPSRL